MNKQVEDAIKAAVESLRKEVDSLIEERYNHIKQQVEALGPLIPEREQELRKNFHGAVYRSLADYQFDDPGKVHAIDAGHRQSA